MQAECGNDIALRREVDWLQEAAATESNDSVHAALETLAVAPPLQHGEQMVAAAPRDYRIVRLLGEGGMGRVYLADRIDGDASQPVALKFLHAVTSSEADLLRRFADERRILATLNHPNIARLLDAGTMADGRPFLALEYVSGERIDRWCEQRGLSLPERLRLFLKVCAAVEYAHRHLVIHRDLKPANILVSDDGEPKLLDFGIARLLDAGLEATPTEVGQRALTLAYASPEQVEGLPLTTAADIWSLGAVLYQLVSGSQPFRQTQSAHHLSQAILSGELTPPSRQTVSVKQGDEVSAAPGRRYGERGGRGIPRDVDAIVLKAMRRDAGERYGSVTELAADLRRFLASRPVLARRGQRWHRLRLFTRRHRLGMVMGGLAVVLLVAGILAREQHLHQVEAERARAQALADFMGSLFENASPMENGGKKFTADELLDRGVRGLQGRTDLAPQTRATLLAAIGWAYGGLGRNQKSIDSLGAALVLLPSDATTVAQRVRLLRRMAEVQDDLGDEAASLVSFEQALALLDPEDPAQAGPRAAVQVRAITARLELPGESLPGLLAEIQQVTAVLEAQIPPSQEDLSDAYNGQGLIQQRMGELADSEISLRKAIHANELAHPGNPAALLNVRMNLATTVVLRDPARGVELLRALDADYVRLVGRYTPTRATLVNQLAVALTDLDRTEEALQASGMAREIALKSTDADNRLYLQLSVGHAFNLLNAGRLDDVEQVLHEVMPALRRAADEGIGGVNLAYALGVEGRALFDYRHDPAAALKVLVEGEQAFGPGMAARYLVVYRTLMTRLVKVYLALHDADNADRALQRWEQALATSNPDEDSDDMLNVHLLRAQVSSARGRYDEAAATAAVALELVRGKRDECDGLARELRQIQVAAWQRGGEPVAGDLPACRVDGKGSGKA